MTKTKYIVNFNLLYLLVNTYLLNVLLYQKFYKAETVKLYIKHAQLTSGLTMHQLNDTQWT